MVHFTLALFETDTLDTTQSLTRFLGYIILFRCGQSFITSKVLSTAFEEV